MNILLESLKELRDIKEAFEDWTELPTHEDVVNFGEGSKWCVAWPGSEGERFFNEYTKNGNVFVGKGEGKNRILALKKPDGTIFNKFDLNDTAVNESLNENVESTIPVQPLPHDELFAAIDAAKPGSYVNVGYFKEVTKTHVQAKFTGGRGSEGNPMVRLFKATEVYGRCGIDHEEIQAIKDKRAAGIERKGNLYEIESELGNKIFRVPGTGNELLQLYPRSKSDLKSRYFISLDDEDLRVATKEEVELYCKPSSIASRGEFDPSSPMRFNLNNIYWFKNLGQSILR